MANRFSFLFLFTLIAIVEVHAKPFLSNETLIYRNVDRICSSGEGMRHAFDQDSDSITLVFEGDEMTSTMVLDGVTYTYQVRHRVIRRINSDTIIVEFWGGDLGRQTERQVVSYASEGFSFYSTGFGEGGSCNPGEIAIQTYVFVGSENQ